MSASRDAFPSESEIIGMISELASKRVVCTDINPESIRATPNSPKLVESSTDMKPYTDAGFLKMCLEAFICIGHSDSPDFKGLVEETMRRWDPETTHGFIDFFNKAYSLYLDRKGVTEPIELHISNGHWMKKVVSDSINRKMKLFCLSDLSGEGVDYPVLSIEDIDPGSDSIVISGQPITPELMERLKGCLEKKTKVRLMIPNPFFHGYYSEFKKKVESKGVYFDILAHSDPVPCEGGMRSDYILLELRDRPLPECNLDPVQRNEDYIFVICGRNVPPECYLRCWCSLESQHSKNWGAVIIDDASDNEAIDSLIRSTIRTHGNITYIHNNKRRTMLPNIVHAVKDICGNPNSAIITLDMDDALLNDYALDMLRDQYDLGHDVVSSTCLRKGVRILPYEIKYDDARERKKAGDVWMHLRSFRKYLFDRIDDKDFMDGDEWIEIFNELTFMVPITEMSSNPIQIKVPLYLWEPRTVEDEKHRLADLHTMKLIASREPYPKLRPFPQD